MPAVPPDPTILHGKHVLFVVWLDSKAHLTDLKVQQHLESLGCVVKLVDDVAPPTART